MVIIMVPIQSRSQLELCLSWKHGYYYAYSDITIIVSDHNCRNILNSYALRKEVLCKDFFAVGFVVNLGRRSVCLLL